MKVFGWEITKRPNSHLSPATSQKALGAVSESRGGWFPIIREWATGYWQANIEVDNNLVLSYHAVFACLTLIASDISKLRIKLVEQQGFNGIWKEVESPAFSPVLRKPNKMQNRIQFIENWVLSKLMRGNTYVLKQRDERNVVVALYVLDPNRCRPLVADNGDVFYELNSDNITSIREPIIVPDTEIIHDRMNCLFHPLIGVSPIWANGLAATQGLRIQNNSVWFFGNKSIPGGVLSAPGHIKDDTAARIKAAWDSNYTGENAGKIAVLGDGLKFEAMNISAEDSQLIEQLKWTAEVVCSTFHVPPYKIGVGAIPAYNNVQALNVEYYSQALQSLIESIELCLDEGLNTGKGFGTEFDLDNLLRMDTVTLVQSIKEAVAAGIMSPNEGRKKLDMEAVVGGDTPYLQQQNYSLAALNKRDTQDDPFASLTGPKPQLALPAPSGDDDDDDDSSSEDDVGKAIDELDEHIDLERFTASFAWSNHWRELNEKATS